MSRFYPQLEDRSSKKLALLIDPDAFAGSYPEVLAELLKSFTPDLLLVGGSLLFKSLEDTMIKLKKLSQLPVFIFPGSSYQLSGHADGLLFLSLISGRNPEFLIGNQVIAAPQLFDCDLELIPTGYMLIGQAQNSSVEYMSQTRPIPAEKIDIALATAMAGELLGLKSIYLEAGSGAAEPVPVALVKQLRERISLPLIVGGGIRSARQASALWEAGADMLVVGNALEKDPTLLKDLCRLRDQHNG